MLFKLEDLKSKNIVNVRNGTDLGFVDDIVIDTLNAKVLSLVVYGKKKFFGIFGREEDILIPWKDIKIIGDDVVLINVDCVTYSNNHNKKRNFFKNLFK